MQSNPQDNKEKVNISLSVDKTMLERGIFVIVILLLGCFVFFNPFGQKCDLNEGVNSMTGNAILEQQPRSSDANTSTEAASITEDIVEDKKEEDKKQEAVGSLENNLVFKIDEVNYEKDEMKPLRMKNIQMILFNEWKNFRPLIVVYWYDEDSSDAIKQKKRATAALKESEFGVRQVFTIEHFDSTFFDPSRSNEIIKAELYNEETNELLKKDTKNIE